MATTPQTKQQTPLQNSGPAIAQPFQSSPTKPASSSGTNTAQNQIGTALQQIAVPQKNNTPSPSGNNQPLGGNNTPTPPAANNGGNTPANQPPAGNTKQNANPAPSTATATVNANGVKATSTGNNSTLVTNGNTQATTQTTTNANGTAATATAVVKVQSPAPAVGNPAPVAQAKPAAAQAKPAATDQAAIGTTINDFFNMSIGGVSPLNQQTLVQDATKASGELQQATQNGTFTGVTAIHANLIAGNFQQAIPAINGTANAQNMKYLGDLTRDINDIIQGDPGLKGLNATPLPNAATPAAPFQDNAAQTAFLNDYNNSVGTIATQAAAAAKTGMPNSAQSQAAIQSVQNLITTSDQFSTGQGGIFSARFNNELTANGTNGVAGNALILALQNGDATAATTAIGVLQGNVADLGMNQTPNGGGAFAFAGAAA